MATRNESSKIYFSRNYQLLLAFIIPITILGLFFIGIFTIPLIMSSNNGIKLTNYELWSAIILNILVLGFVIYVWVIGYTESSIEFTDTYLRKKGFLRSATLNWSDISSVSTIGARIIIQSQSRKVEVNMVFYHEPEEMIKFIQNQTSKDEGRGNNIVP